MLKVTIFGNVSLTNGTVTLGEEDIRANKLVQLLIYMICNRETVVTGKQLSEQFWSGNSRNPGNPENALKNLMYRLRSVLKLLGPEEYIRTCRGGYQWNPEIALETDYEQFERLNREIKRNQDGAGTKELCKKAVSCYRGNISNRLVYEAWLQPWIIRYQTKYLEIIKILCGIYERENEWEELEDLCEKAVEKEPLDEDIQCWLVRSLQRQQKYDQALYQYERAGKQFYEALGIGMPERLQRIFQETMADNRMQSTNVVSIMQEAGEKEESKGAFFCDYQIFRQIYRLEIRRIGRMGVSEYMLLLTVQRVGGVWTGVDTRMIEGVCILEQVIRGNLRAGDVVAKNGPNQYVVLLSACSYEAGISVTRRIRRKFMRRMKHHRMELKYELKELSYQKQEEKGKESGKGKEMER